ncbi:MAG: PilZ domain-containing protein [Candidatus Omnitrophota bacterium]|nr:PilZ domain-containing protein [Candidatus Omnitrophota bacterium]
MSWDGMNRRKFPRENYPCLLIVRKNHAAPEAMLTHTENIGIGGVCVILKKDLKMFAPLELEIDLLDTQRHIKCEGKIVWVVKRRDDATTKPSFYDTGIEFVNLSKEDEKRINFIVARLMKLGYREEE